MKIEHVNSNRVRIESLRSGDVFVDDNGSVLMYIEHVPNEDGDDEYNAVSLEDGLLYCYNEASYVDKKPNAILKI